ncbi:hypothetical protein RN2511_013080 [Rhodococcus sp. NKCM2511]|nr:hypothetical protein RN2511_013080 [Rhodococcus sp. NKCM2511]
MAENHGKNRAHRCHCPRVHEVDAQIADVDPESRVLRQGRLLRSPVEFVGPVFDEFTKVTDVDTE